MNRNDHELAAHHSWLRRMARRLARSSTRVDDLIQDTYVTALRNAPPDVQLRPWLRAVMRKLAWGEVRSERRRIQREQGFSLMAPAQRRADQRRLHGDRGAGTWWRLMSRGGPADMCWRLDSCIRCGSRQHAIARYGSFVGTVSIILPPTLPAAAADGCTGGP